MCSSIADIHHFNHLLNSYVVILLPQCSLYLFPCCEESYILLNLFAYFYNCYSLMIIFN